MTSSGADPPPAGSSGAGRGRGEGNARGRGKGRGGGGGGGGGRTPGNPRGGASGRSQRGRGRAGNGTGNAQTTAAVLPQPADVSPETQLSTATVPPASRPAGTVAASRKNGDDNDNDDDDDDVEAEVCFICASPVVHQAVTPCNHRTCHICALRMRALYKNNECAHCRTPAKDVIFTDDATKRFEDYTDADISSRDLNIGIRYANEEIVGDTVLLLRYNCPDDSCDFAGLGWPDLHRHVRSVHHKKMCDLCTRNKKVFTHEHELFADKELEQHMKVGDDLPGAADQTGFKGHPMCGFCRSRFYDDDKLYEHCRERHERCFICDRENPRQPHYYRNYDSLEDHFRKDHYLCSDRECLEKKFVVFGSDVDLKAHQLSEHAGSLSKDMRRDARSVNMAAFDFRQPYQEPRRGGGGGGGRGRDRDGAPGGSSREGRGRGRDPNAEPLPASSAQPLRRDELAFQRQMAIHSSQSVSNRTFGGQLSSSAAPPPAASTGPTTTSTSTPTSASAGTPAAPPTTELETLSLTDPNLTAEDRARLTRHAAVIERATGLLRNDRGKLDEFRAHISSYRQGGVGAAGLVENLFSLFADTASSSALGTLMREIADLFEDRGKADALRKAWNDWRAVNEDYPTLPGLGGMRGATTASSGWASAAASASASPASAAVPGQRYTTRVLKLKNSTQQSRRSSAGPGSSSPASTPSWVAGSSSSSRPAPSASASAFPALPPVSGTKSNGANNNNTSASSAALWGTTTSSSSSNQPRTQQQPRAAAKAPSRGEDAFPALPAAPKPTSSIMGYGRGNLRRDLGGGRDTGFSWGGGGGSSSSSGQAGGSGGGEDDDVEAGGKGGKKGNKGRKKMLMQWG